MRAALVIIVVLAVLSLVAILVVGRGQSRSLETYKTSPRLNPLPSPDEVAEARLWIPAAQGEAGNTAVLLSPDQYAQFRRLFDNSQRDPDPAKWQKGGYAELLLRDGNRKAVCLYRTHKPPGAFSCDSYYRGASDEALEGFCQALGAGVR